MFRQLSLIAALAASGMAPASAAELDLASAQRLAAAAAAACGQQGRVIAVAVVDRGGALLLLQRDPSVGPHNAEASRRKAFTALSTRKATLALARDARADPDTANLATLPELLLLGGGLPLLVKASPVGAIGVAGGGGPGNDHACASAAIAATGGFDQPT
ncbi:GlcG/HbpS family heme-binding protein [Massilia yuzhufengensis]|uniref:Uncharacterized conserved protein GlcG, DUF336 family n=1 Tax=Massilia yuzhufengensis TaxID=1164594 RepID=A0A1I1VX55_9BURK|nr:heme-binding protein [Massilia yuzhufengensis]SFD87471.1 Uncharacterized conserved protein GlcG, DUF336 family [Massilia yuzhufengensis]